MARLRVLLPGVLLVCLVSGLSVAADAAVLGSETAISRLTVAHDLGPRHYADGEAPTPMSRGQLAYLMAHSVGGFESFEPPSVITYDDVPTDFCVLPEIEYVSSLGLMLGYADSTFLPDSVLARDQMAVYTSRALDRRDGDYYLFLPPTTPTYTDVAADTWAYPYVEYIASKGITADYADRAFRPTLNMDLYLAADWLQQATGSYVDPSTIPGCVTPVGAVAGTVTDEATGQPIFHAFVSCGEDTTSTDMNGAYALSEVPAGPRIVQVEASSHYPVSREIVVVPGATVYVGFALPAYMEVPDPAPFSRAQSAWLIAHSFAGFGSYLPPAIPTCWDVPADHCVYAEIEYVLSLGVMLTYGDSSFHCDEIVTRPMVAVVTANLINLSDGDLGAFSPPAEPTFPDLEPQHWAYLYVEYIVSKGVSAGYPDGTFRPKLDMDLQLAVGWLEQATGAYVDPEGLPDCSSIFGSLTGSVRDAHTQQPIAAAAVSCNSRETFTDVDGAYLFEGVVQGLYYGVQASADHYQPSQVHYLPVLPRQTTTLDFELTPIETFSDVGSDFWAWESVEDCAWAGITGGYDDGKFHPERLVSRDQMAVLLVRARGEEPADPTDPQSWTDAYGYDPADPATWEVSFTDVPPTGYGLDGTAPYWAWYHIQRLYHIGVTKGITPTEYGPTQDVNRDQMAAFLVRALGLECANPCEDPGCWPYDPAATDTWAYDFADIPATGQDTCTGAYWAWFHIQALYDTGVTVGCDEANYCPEEAVRRDQMAVFLVRAFMEP